MLRRAAWPADYKADIARASLWRTTHVRRGPQQGTPCPISAEFFGTHRAELPSLPPQLTSEAPLTAMFTPPCTGDVRELPRQGPAILHRTWPARVCGGLVALLPSMGRLPRRPAPRQNRHGSWNGRRQMDRASATRPPRHRGPRLTKKMFALQTNKYGK